MANWEIVPICLPQTTLVIPRSQGAAWDAKAWDAKRLAPRSEPLSSFEKICVNVPRFLDVFDAHGLATLQALSSPLYTEVRSSVAWRRIFARSVSIPPPMLPMESAFVFKEAVVGLQSLNKHGGWSSEKYLGHHANSCLNLCRRAAPIYLQLRQEEEWTKLLMETLGSEKERYLRDASLVSVAMLGELLLSTAGLHAALAQFNSLNDAHCKAFLWITLFISNALSMTPLIIRLSQRFLNTRATQEGQLAHLTREQAGIVVGHAALIFQFEMYNERVSQQFGDQPATRKLWIKESVSHGQREEQASS